MQYLAAAVAAAVEVGLGAGVALGVGVPVVGKRVEVGVLVGEEEAYQL